MKTQDIASMPFSNDPEFLNGLEKVQAFADDFGQEYYQDAFDKLCAKFMSQSVVSP